MFEQRPHGLVRIALRAPAGLYRIGAGRLLGHRFLLLTHRGRKTGRTFRTPIEVVRWYAAAREATVISAWGTRSDWVRNIAASPPVVVEIAGERWRAPSHRILDQSEVAILLNEYRRDHVIAARALARLLGWPTDPTPDEVQDLALRTTAVAFRPRDLAALT